MNEQRARNKRKKRTSQP